MLTDEQILEINNDLELYGTSKLTTSEINFINQLDYDLSDQCKLMSLELDVIKERSTYTDNMGRVFRRYYKIAETRGCNPPQETPSTPEVKIPVYGF